VYHGPRARWLYFECLQLLLRKQIAALTREWHLPREFEVRLLARGPCLG
jgi:RNA polymerase I-specific transcription initiation factor RRN7